MCAWRERASPVVENEERKSVFLSSLSTDIQTSQVLAGHQPGFSFPFPLSLSLSLRMIPAAAESMAYWADGAAASPAAKTAKPAPPAVQLPPLGESAGHQQQQQHAPFQLPPSSSARSTWGDSPVGGGWGRAWMEGDENGAPPPAVGPSKAADPGPRHRRPAAAPAAPSPQPSTSSSIPDGRECWTFSCSGWLFVYTFGKRGRGGKGREGAARVPILRMPRRRTVAPPRPSPRNGQRSSDSATFWLTDMTPSLQPTGVVKCLKELGLHKCVLRESERNNGRDRRARARPHTQPCARLSLKPHAPLSLPLLPPSQVRLRHRHLRRRVRGLLPLLRQ